MDRATQRKKQHLSKNLGKRVEIKSSAKSSRHDKIDLLLWTSNSDTVNLQELSEKIEGIF